ncbi:MAG TPA: hypothetical protein VJL80_05820 [Aeromicrobium sp.]|nr:hypothetical protein [Aeromicrobium sp.]HKY57536.1 hypothetical protein [Aeromicrobium sp.]
MKILRVIEAFATTVDGVPRMYTEGMLVKSTDPIVKGRERHFMDSEAYADRLLAETYGIAGGTTAATETATAAPGERRARSVAKKATKPAKAEG